MESILQFFAYSLAAFLIVPWIVGVPIMLYVFLTGNKEWRPWDPIARFLEFFTDDLFEYDEVPWYWGKWYQILFGVWVMLGVLSAIALSFFD